MMKLKEKPNTISTQAEQFLWNAMAKALKCNATLYDINVALIDLTAGAIRLRIYAGNPVVCDVTRDDGYYEVVPIGDLVFDQDSAVSFVNRVATAIDNLAGRTRDADPLLYEMCDDRYYDSDDDEFYDLDGWEDIY